MCRVIIDIDDIAIITAFNYLYCLLSTQMKNTFFIGLVGLIALIWFHNSTGLATCFNVKMKNLAFDTSKVITNA